VNKRVRKTGRITWILSFVIFGLLTPVSGSAFSFFQSHDSDSKKVKRFPESSPQFIYNVDGSLLAQTSEVTIMLEKKISPPQDQLTVDQEPPLEKEVPQSEKGDASDTGPVNGKESQALDQTAYSGLETSPSPEFYKELEDPFAPPPGEKIPELKDPFEKYNRFMFSVNESLYDYLMEPVARGWRYVLPEDVRIVISNAFDNALAPVKLVSSLMQGDLDKSGRVLGRTFINTTAGLGGMLDVAGQEYGIENVNEDFDQAMGYHKVPTGPYIILPFIGPSTARNVVGRAADSFLSPSYFFSPSILVGAGITAAETTNDTSFIIEDKKALGESAIDEYESVRDFYHQYREGLLKK